MKGTLTRNQFDAAELQTRRQIAARLQVFDPEELRLLDYVIERSFRLGRTAAYFRSFRQLGKATETHSHAHEALHRLVRKKVLAPLPLTTSRWHWYGFNLNFLDWPAEQKRPKEFWEEPALPFEPELDEMLRETFVEFSAGSLSQVATTVTDRDRDAGSAPVPHADKDAAGLKTPPRPTSGDDPKTGGPPAQDKPDEWREKFSRLKHALKHNLPLDEFLEAAERTPAGYASVPPEGTKVYPGAKCTPGGYTENSNSHAETARAVPPQGTSIASSASVQKAELLAMFAAVPLQGTEGYNEKVALALGWLEKIDRTAGLKVKRFQEQWAQVCKAHPDYVLKVCPNVLARQVELQGDVPKPLALLAHVARADNKMR